MTNRTISKSLILLIVAIGSIGIVAACDPAVAHQYGMGHTKVAIISLICIILGFFGGVYYTKNKK
ncbi:MAG: hypothetical protein LRZ92_04260 [Methanosarcinaceae archaeon]|nr:hypothetical protein [Methanosarcinaceae archaeon]NKQ38990.1 hypothetical protein [Methanosarcinales archaeon]